MVVLNFGTRSCSNNPAFEATIVLCTSEVLATCTYVSCTKVPNVVMPLLSWAHDNIVSCSFTVCLCWQCVLQLEFVMKYL